MAIFALRLGCFLSKLFFHSSVVLFPSSPRGPANLWVTLFKCFKSVWKRGNDVDKKKTRYEVPPLTGLIVKFELLFQSFVVVDFSVVRQPNVRFYCEKWIWIKIWVTRMDSKFSCKFRFHFTEILCKGLYSTPVMSHYMITISPRSLIGCMPLMSSTMANRWKPKQQLL